MTAFATGRKAYDPHMVGIEAVAKQAGVSVSTVSRALRDIPGVSPATRERVRGAAAELGFVLSIAGSRLATGRTGTVAIIVPTAGAWFFGQTITGAGAVVRSAGTDLLLFELGDPDGRRRFFAEQRLRGRADGVIVLSVNLTPSETEMLGKLGIPVVSLGTPIEGFGCVRVDNHAAAVSAVRHLVNLGHERIGYIGIAGRDDATSGSGVLEERAEGYRTAMREAGLALERGFEQSDVNTADGGRRAMSRLLSAAAMPTGLFVGSDEMAFGALDVLRSSGLSVPGDVSVIGFDNHAFSDIVGLSTVDQGVREQGEAAARILLDAIESPDGERADLVLPTQLVLRGSTAPPRGQTQPETAKA